MKEPKFYCENCGKPVSLRANSCPSCGRTFEAVKCPECGFSGKAGLFSDGCPTCGFMSSLTSAIAPDPGIMEVDLGGDSYAGASDRQEPKSRRPLPGWAYTLITLGLIGVLIALLIIYLNLD